MAAQSLFLKIGRCVTILIDHVGADDCFLLRVLQIDALATTVKQFEAQISCLVGEQVLTSSSIKRFE